MGGRVVEANAIVEHVDRESIQCLALFGGVGCQPLERPADAAAGLRGNQPGRLTHMVTQRC